MEHAMIERARAAVLPEPEEQQLAASVRQRLFDRPAEPVRVGRYRLLERLGQGGMGVVFVAHDEQLDRRVALKLLHASHGRSDLASQARLRREAQALARLSHPNVVQVFEVGEAAGRAFVAMELVRGVTLRAWLADRPRAVDEILDVFLEAGRGLAAAHAAGLVHRDFKPENALVGDDGRVRVVDFGLVGGDGGRAEVGGPGDARGLAGTLTETGAVLGTPAYMAPEQADGGAAIDGRSDQFSFCVALWEALHRERPFAGAAAAGRIRPPPPRSAVPARVRRALHRGLERDPAARWPTMDALLAAIDPRPVRARVRLLAVAALSAAIVAGAVAAGGAALRAQRAHAGERAAAARLEIAEARWRALLAAGERAAAERLLADVVAAPEIRGTAVGADAWGRWARLLEHGDAAAPGAWANAYVQARAPASRRAALVGLVEAARARRRWHTLASAVALIERDAPEVMAAPQVMAARLDVAATRRDLPAALALTREADAPADRRALAPVLAQLVRMTRTEHRHVHGVHPAVDGPGALRLDVRPPEAPARAVIVDAAPGLPLRRVEAPGPVPAGTGRAIEADGDALVLRDAGGSAELQRWPAEGMHPERVHAADVDGDGVEEIYVAGQRQLRALARGPDGVWRRTIPHAGTEAARSDVDVLTSADLDRDGRPELIAALGPWSAYDVRVFRAPGPGALELVARRKLGHTAGVVPIETPGGPRLVALTTETYPNSTVFPAGHPLGASLGFYVLRLDGAALTVERALPAPGTSESPRVPRTIYVGDVDGDGLEDIVAGFDHPKRFEPLRHAVHVARQLPDGEFAALTIDALSFHGLVQLDDDPALELLLAAGDDRELWIAGAGEATLAPAPLPGSELAEPRADALAAAGAPPDVVALARVGALELALTTAVQAAALADEPRRRRLHLAAARIAEDLHEPARALALLEDAAEDPALRPEALERLVADLLELGRLAEAAAASRRWRAATGLSADARARATALAAKLTRLDERRVEVPLRLAGTAARAEPSALRRDPLRGALVLDSFAGRPVAAAWPLAWSGDPLVVELAVAPIELQWSSTLELRLVAGEATVARLSARVTGGDIHHDVVLTCGAAHSGIGLRVQPDGALEPFTLRLFVDPEEGRIDCRLTPEGERAPLVLRDRWRRPAAGPLRLEIGAEPGQGAAPLVRARVELRSLALAGATVAGAPPGPLEAAATLLIDGEATRALAALAAGEGPRAALWRAVALVELGRWADAGAALRAALDAAADGAVLDELRHFLRARPGALGPVVREVVGERRYFEMFVETWSINPGLRVFPRETLAEIVAGLGGVELGCGAPAICRALLRARGRAYAQLGDRGRAREDLERALAQEAGAEAARERAALHIDLAALAAGDGEPARALEHARAALALDPAVEVGRDVLRARPELAPLLTTPQWQALLGPDDRTFGPEG